MFMIVRTIIFTHWEENLIGIFKIKQIRLGLVTEIEHDGKAHISAVGLQAVCF